MIEQLIYYFKRHSGDVGTQTCGLDYVNRMAQARGQYFSLPRVVLIDLDNVLKQIQAVLADVVESAEKWTDE